MSHCFVALTFPLFSLGKIVIDTVKKELIFLPLIEQIIFCDCLLFRGFFCQEVLQGTCCHNTSFSPTSKTEVLHLPSAIRQGQN